MAVLVPSDCDLTDPGAVPRRGRIIMHEGRLSRIDRLWLPTRTSVARVWLDMHLGRRLSPDTCVLTYRGTRARPGYLAVEYARSGPGTRLATIGGALAILDQVARLRQCVAIVAHISTWAISDRALRRFGWESQTAESRDPGGRDPRGGRLSGRHWIKRFYDGYPAHDWERYCRMSPARIKR